MSILDALLGRPIATREEHAEKIGPAVGIPVLGLDALASAAYGPEAALTILLPLGALGLGYSAPILGLIILLLVIVFLSYQQTIAAYPSGGGSYVVARANLGSSLGLLAAAALMLDYVLVVAVGISAGVGAIISAFPALQPHTLALCLAILGFITVMNLRGIRESGVAFMLPTYLFVISLFGVICWGTLKSLSGTPLSLVTPPTLAAAGASSLSLWLLVQAFASGCTAMTGVEAVSNGVPLFRQPVTRNATHTLRWIIGILIFLLAGIGYLTQVYRVGATVPGTTGYESVLSQLIGAIIGKGFIYVVTMSSVVCVLALSANTGFADFPRLCQILAQDDYLPRFFASRGRRLVFTQGILLIAALAALLLVAFQGVTDRLIPLFAIGAFTAFTVSQAGMVVHWNRQRGDGWPWRLAINALGCLATGLTLLVVLLAKFHEGAWITLLLIPCVVALFAAIRRHYRQVSLELATSLPIDSAPQQRPLVVVPISGWSRLSRQAIQLARNLSDEVHCVHVCVDASADRVQGQWEELVETPLRQAGQPVPRWVVVESPYRRLFTPLLGYLEGLRTCHPQREILVVVGELVENRWYHFFLHNQHAQVLKALLWLHGGRNVAVVSTPWRLSEGPLA